ncbi:hypothetical protein DICPUDRAFT_150325 [Dictyostelium purpureum]|uniref:EGF-like domain-containing protein n=1 Tax=Dictyostelium purpureum TaxID=5786 RepID=F0ZG16_DICPU|nr:uncharacterized protein DICPUDRAFT_150325 [Dictyostelium purpureum]EGC37102.1 hypothetical protein DICPUDRAFT_150325 [Dictyostelium purpureum]|eukprot:XP_003286383.1 hypothetical protein DICPUDRAFT_150325 [Dictyostelium purpureum]
MKFYFFLFYLFNLIYLSKSDISSNDVTCLNTLGKTVGDPRYYDANIGQTFCKLATSACTSDEKILAIEVSQSTGTLYWDLLTCLTDLTSLRGLGLVIQQDFISSIPPTIKRFYLLIYLFDNDREIVTSNLVSIISDIPPLDYFYIGGLLGPIKSSFIKRVKEFRSPSTSKYPNPSYLEVDTNDNSLGNLEKIEIALKSIPNLFYISSLKEVDFDILKTADVNSFDNFYSFTQISVMTFRNTDNSLTIPFPKKLAENLNPSYSKITFDNIKITTNDYIDFSNIVNECALAFHNPGSGFNVNGNFPLRLPKTKLSELYITNGVMPIAPDFNIFKNVSNLILFALGTEGTLPPIAADVDFSNVDLSNNKFTNSLDESWCGIPIYIIYNDILSVPPCFQCYFDDSRVSSLFTGNTNLQNKLVNCSSYDTIVPKFTVIVDKQLIITGKNIGYYADNIISTPSIPFVREGKNRFIGDLSGVSSALTTMNIHWTIPDISFTIGLRGSRPHSTAITQDKNILSFEGFYYSYNPLEVSITVENLTCTVYETSFNAMKCKLPLPVKLQGFYFLRVDVNGLFLDTLFNFTSTICPSPVCNGNGVCDYDTGECKCDDKYTTVGDNVCSIPNHRLTSYSQVLSTQGGPIILNGYFGTENKELSVKIGSNNCVVNSVSSEAINCTIPAGSGLKSINITQNNLVWLGKIYPYYDPVILCPNDCTSPSNGKCLSSGSCLCNTGFKGLDCSVIIKNDTNIEEPKTETNVTDGNVILSNEESDFKISIDSIRELDIENRIVQSKSIGNWSIYKEKSNEISSFIQIINNATIILTIEEIGDKDKNFEFAGNNFTVESGGIKMSISINDWEYTSVLNVLQIVMVTNYHKNLTKESNNCNEDNIKIKSSSNSNSISESVNYLKIENKGKLFYGRFQDKAMSNNHTVFITTQLLDQSNNDLVYLGINLPHCDECLIDPDFSLLISPNYKNQCDNGRKAWFLPVVIVVPIVGIVCIIIISAIIYKRHRESFKIKINQIKLGKLN